MPPRKLSPITAAGPREIAGQSLVEIPSPPPFLNEVGRRKFEEVAAYLVDLGCLTAGEVPLVEMYAAAYSRWAGAEEQLSGGDPGWRVVITRQGTEGSAVPTAAMIQSKQSIDQLRRLGAALGLAPVERAKLPATRQPGEEDKVDRIFREAGYG
jgi:P27 family predicted phage terminase small subunit